jgi:hypothetical protein
MTKMIYVSIYALISNPNIANKSAGCISYGKIGKE